MKEKIENPQKEKIKEIIDSLWQKLPDMGRKLIAQSLDLSNPLNQRFFENPDDSKEHTPAWHQWGIITHTRKFEEFHHTEIPVYLAEWGLEQEVNSKLSEEIDIMSKRDLFDIAIVLHDLGKFTNRTIDLKNEGVTYHFKKHESASGEIVRSKEISGMLQSEFGLTAPQIEYIAHLTELHYELGILRDRVKNTIGYTLNYAKSEACRIDTAEIMAKHPGFELEVALLFLGDSLAKTDIRIKGASSDAEIEAQSDRIKELLEDRGLDPRLLDCAKQIAVNVAVVETYLQIYRNL